MIEKEPLHRQSNLPVQRLLLRNVIILRQEAFPIAGHRNADGDDIYKEGEERREETEERPIEGPGAR